MRGSNILFISTQCHLYIFSFLSFLCSIRVERHEPSVYKDNINITEFSFRCVFAHLLRHSFVLRFVFFTSTKVSEKQGTKPKHSFAFGGFCLLSFLSLSHSTERAWPDYLELNNFKDPFEDPFSRDFIERSRFLGCLHLRLLDC
ncbi:unnamed protein product [Citrullus colocynthis]|uniref:Secreted protein n=1 Tax=Citrullus colocynthis TaxID=252529 RepID=A0ABP0XXT3_9ROSI